MKLKKLFEPITIGSMKLKNRIVMSAFDSHHAAKDGSMTPRLMSFLAERARGGAGLVTTGFAYIDQKASKYSHGQLGAYDDSLIVGLNLLSEAIQTEGARASLQIAHCGRQKTISGPVAAPSSVSWRSWTTGEDLTPTELTIDEIEEIIDAYGQAARRGRQARFDAIELHAGHGYLITNFLSPRTNKRRDGYGGDLKNRMRFLLETVRRIKEATGERFPLICKITVDEYFENGITIKESTEVAKKLEDIGVGAIVASAGCHEGPYEVPPMFLPAGVNVHLAHELKKVVTIPVAAIGAINDPELAERIIAEGKADLVAMARPLIADPYLPVKVERGQIDDIRKCIRCNQTCCERSTANLEIRCAINPAAGRELDYTFKPAATKKRVVVVGGGPAGMEAARTAALRGHEVVLYEKNALGGQLLLAAASPGKQEINNLTKFLSGQVRKLADVRVGLRATSKLVEEDHPDAVVVATGARLVLPKIRGIENANVTSFEKALLSQVRIGKRALVIGGGEIGLETTYSLLQEPRELTIVTRMPKLAPEMEPTRKDFVMRSILDHHVSVLAGMDVQEMSESEAVAVDRAGNRRSISLDTVVIARGWTADAELFEELKDKFDEIYRVGDCIEPREIGDAIHEASWVANRI